jgi:hypothetical protein
VVAMPSDCDTRNVKHNNFDRVDNVFENICINRNRDDKAPIAIEPTTISSAATKVALKVNTNSCDKLLFEISE